MYHCEVLIVIILWQLYVPFVVLSLNIRLVDDEKESTLSKAS